jgi:amino acid adenylation domain-containing protein
MSLDKLVIHSAECMPNALAVQDSNNKMTYRELDSLSNQISRALVKLGVCFGDRVGIWLEKSTYTVAVMQAVLRLGAVYVPLDPLAPIFRIRSIISDCTIQALVTTEKRAGSVLTDDLEHISCLCINGNWQEFDWQDVLSLSDKPIDKSRVTNDDTAYILYTSGSTGKPKGVCISHLNALAFINWAARELQVTSADRFSNHAPFHFDLSVLDLYVAFQVGASVHLIPEGMSYIPNQLVHFVVQEEITIWYSVPSVLILMMQQGGLLNLPNIPLRSILFAGELFPIKHLRRLYERWPSVRFLNLYGPTETNVCTFYEVQELQKERVQPVPIGRACSGNQVWAIKEDGTEVKPGEEGELMVSGPTVMRGYWGYLEHGNKPYATGDIVRLQEDGNYVYVCRKDHIVKVRGHRIELGDVEVALEQHPAIHEVTVIVSGEGINARLIAFMVLNKDSITPSLLDIKRHCAERLPRYMIIDEVRYVAQLPRTGNGKVNRLELSSAEINRINLEEGTNAAR